MSNRCSACDILVKDQEIRSNPKEWDVFNSKPLCKRCKHKMQDIEDAFRLIDIPDNNEENAYNSHTSSTEGDQDWSHPTLQDIGEDFSESFEGGLEGIEQLGGRYE